MKTLDELQMPKFQAGQICICLVRRQDLVGLSMKMGFISVFIVLGMCRTEFTCLDNLTLQENSSTRLEMSRFCVRAKTLSGASLPLKLSFKITLRLPTNSSLVAQSVKNPPTIWETWV